MKKKIWLSLWLIAAILLAAGCKAASQSTTATETTAGVDAATPLSSRLAVGILELEDTDLAVTPEQAKAMLPLWKAVKTMSASDTATTAEIDALYDQIAEELTSEQTVAIEAMEMTADEMTSLMAKLGIEPGQFAGGGMANLTEEQRATQIAQFQAEGGMPAGGEMPSGNSTFSGGERPSGGGNGSGERPSFSGGQAGGDAPSGGVIIQGNGMDPGMLELQGTQTSSGTTTTRRTSGMNQMFIEPLIKLLEDRSAS